MTSAYPFILNPLSTQLGNNNKKIQEVGTRVGEGKVLWFETSKLSTPREFFDIFSCIKWDSFYMTTPPAWGLTCLLSSHKYLWGAYSL